MYRAVCRLHRTRPAGYRQPVILAGPLSAPSRWGLAHRESGAQLLAEALHGGTRGGWVPAPRQPQSFSWGEHKIGIILLGDGLQTVPRGVSDHEYRPP